MKVVTVYTKEGCHLCDRVRSRLKELQAENRFDLREIELKEGNALFDQYRERIPVITIDGVFAFEYVLPEREFLRRLKADG